MKCNYCNQKIDKKSNKIGKKLAYLGGKTYHSGCLIKKKNGNGTKIKFIRPPWMTQKTYEILEKRK